jgi:biopolymer transport protein ExbD
MGAGTRGPDNDEIAPISDINVTPFVDVVLVLLVIFIVTAQIMDRDVIGIRLPKAASGEGRRIATLSVAVTRNGNLLVNGQLAGRGELEAEVKRALASTPEAQAIISADRETAHGDVVRAIDWIRTAGLTRFAVQIERETDAR